MFERFRGVERRIDPDVLDVYLRVAEGPRRVGRDGVRCRKVLYTLGPEDQVRLQGRSVWILPSLDDAGEIALVDKCERLLAFGQQQQLVRAGATDEHARAAHARAARVRRLAKAYLPERDFLLQTGTGQILRERRDAARLQEAAVRRTQPAAPAPEITIVRPELAAEVQKRGRKINPFKRLAANMAPAGSDAAISPRETRRAAFAKLAQDTAGDAAPTRARVDWSRYAGDGGLEAAEPNEAQRPRMADAG
jgi:hypothetical protein